MDTTAVDRLKQSKSVVLQRKRAVAVGTPGAVRHINGVVDEVFMAEADELKSELAMQFGEHIIEIDDDVLDEHDPAVTFHVVVIPEVRGGFRLVPEDMNWFLVDETSGYSAHFGERFIHLYIQVDSPLIPTEK